MSAGQCGGCLLARQGVAALIEPARPGMAGQALHTVIVELAAFVATAKATASEQVRLITPRGGAAQRTRSLAGPLAGKPALRTVAEGLGFRLADLAATEAGRAGLTTRNWLRLFEALKASR